MSKPGSKNISPVHVEWTPGWVQAINVETGARASGTDLAALGAFLNGTRQVLVGVGRSQVFLKTIRLPKAAPEDLRRIVSVQLGQLFPLPSDQLSYDFIQTADHTIDGFLTIVAAIRSDDLRQLRAGLQEAGLLAERILPISLAAPVVASRAGLRDAVVIAKSVSGLLLDVVQGGAIRFSRVAPEESDPLHEAQRTMAAARTESLPLVTSEGIDLPEARQSHVSELSVLHEAPPFSFELAEDRIIVEQRRVSARLRLAVLLAISAVMLVLFVFVNRMDAQAKVQQGQNTWNRQLSRLRNLRDSEASRAASAVAIQSQLAQAFQPAQPLSDIVSVTGDALPAGAWMTGLNVERGKALQVRGTAKTSDDVAQFVHTLGANPRFRNVKLVFANSAAIGKTPVVQFSVIADCVGNLSMPAAPQVTGGVRRSAGATAAGVGANR